MLHFRNLKWQLKIKDKLHAFMRKKEAGDMPWEEEEEEKIQVQVKVHG